MAKEDKARRDEMSIANHADALKLREAERKRMEALLKDIQIQQRAILDNIPDMAWLKDKDSRYIAVNEAFGRACGFKPEELVGRTDLDVWPRDLAERYRADDREVMESGKRKYVEEPLADKEGKIKWLETIKTPIYNEKGEIIGTTGIARDITERKKFEERMREVRHELEIKVKVRTAELSKANEDLRKYINERRQAEIALQESEKRLADIINFLPDATFVIDTEGKVIAWNKAMEQLTGIKSPDMVGKANYEYAVPFYGIRRPILIDLVLKPTPDFEKEYPFVKRDKDALITEIFLPTVTEKGIFVWAKAVPLYDAEGRMIGAIESIRDITEHKKIEKELASSESQYRLTLDSMNQAIHVVDKNLRIILVNEIFRKWNAELGFEADLAGKTVFEAFPFLADKIRDEYRRVFETGKILVTEEVNELKGKEIITETRKIPIFEGKVVTRIVTVIEDITVRKRLEYILRESEERYKRIAEAITDYIFTVFVENGKPVKTVYGHTCLAVTGYSTEEFQADPYLWIRMVPEEDRKIVQEYSALILSGEKTFSFEHRIIKKDGSLRWVRNTSVAHQDNWGNLLSYDGLIQDITERKLIENRLTKINECFLNFDTNPIENINRLTALCGQLLGADCALYNRLEATILYTLGKWNVPPDFPLQDSPKGHICFEETIKSKHDDILIVPDLQRTPYAKTDPSIARYNLQTYIGYPVKLAGEHVGSLCVLYKRDYRPSPEDKKIIGIIASAMGVEEERRSIRRELEYRIKFEDIITSVSSRFIKIKPEESDNEIQHALKTIGEFVGVDRSYIFLVNEEKGTADNLYEWCAQGVEPLIDKLKGLTQDAYPWFAEKLKKSEIIHIPRLSSFPPEAKAEKELIKEQGVKSLIIVPMVYGQSIVGFIGFDSVHKEKTWSVESISLLNTLGEIFTNALERKQADQAAREGERFLASIFSSIQDGISILDKEYTIIRVNSTMERWYAHSMPVVGKKCFEAYHGRHEPCKTCPTQHTIYSGETAHEVVPKTGAGGEIVGWLDLYTFPWLDTATGQLRGAIEYVRDITERKRAEKKLEILNRELMNSNRRLKQLALRDSHTGLYNHRYLEEAIEAEFYRARRYAHPISVLMLDIDYFKSINDVYGHQFGDLALKQLAGFLKKMVRRYDIIIRFGGEEFVIICPGADRATALVLGQRLLDSINGSSFGNKVHTVKLKLSIAVASYPEDKIAKGIDMVELADQILNKVKEYGGNRVYSSLDLKREKAVLPEKKKESADAKSLKEKLEKLNKRANQSLIEAVFAFAKTIEVKDHYTGEHVEKTVHYAMEIADALKLPRYEIELIKQAAMLHDLGKIGISEKVLLKSSKLKKDEFEEIKKHPQIGVDILRPIQFFHNIIPLILYHHERWDGTGYPRGLKGEEIPIGARIIAISDVYQALISDRPYRKKAYTKEEAIKIIKDGSGTQFDPKIVTIFLHILQKEE